MLTCRDPIFEDDLFLGLKAFFNLNRKYSLIFDKFEFNKSLKEIDNTFLSLRRDESGQLYIEFKNPSVSDFLINYLTTHEDIHEDILSSAIFFNQFNTVFSFASDTNEGLYYAKSPKPILLSPELTELSRNKIINEVHKMKFTNIREVRYSSQNSSSYRYIYDSEVSKLAEIIRIIKPILNNNLLAILVKDFEALNIHTILRENKLGNFLFILKFLKEQDIKLHDISSIITEVFNWSDSIEDLNHFKKFETLFPDEFELFLEDELSFDSTIEKIIKNDLSHIDPDSWDSYVEELKELNGYLFLDLSEKIAEIEDDFKDIPNDDFDFPDYSDHSKMDNDTEESDIDHLYDSLTN